MDRRSFFRRLAGGAVAVAAAPVAVKAAPTVDYKRDVAAWVRDCVPEGLHADKEHAQALASDGVGVVFLEVYCPSCGAAINWTAQVPEAYAVYGRARVALLRVWRTVTCPCGHAFRARFAREVH